MPPIIPNIVPLVLSIQFNAGVWSSNTSDVLDQLQAASETANPDVMWPWFEGLFSYMSSFFVWNTAFVGADTAKDKLWDQLVHFVAQPGMATGFDAGAMFADPQQGGLAAVWFTVFMLIVCIPFFLGFGVYGVIAGSPAALFQSVVYGAFTPAGSVFAILTSIGMSFLCPPLAALAAAFASLVTFIIWLATSYDSLAVGVDLLPATAVFGPTLAILEP